MPLLGRRGNALLLAHDPIAWLATAYRRYGSISGLVRDDPTVVVALGPDANQQLLANPDLWQHSIPQHTTLSAASRYVELHYEAALRLTERMLDRWGLGCQLDVAYVMRELTLQAAITVLLGEHTSDVARQLAAAVRRWSQHNSAVPFALLRTSPGLAADRHSPHLSREVAFCLGGALARRREHAARNQSSTLLDVLLQARETDGSRVPDDAIVRRAMLLLRTGPATSAAMLAWTFFSLSQHPRILADLQAELARVLKGAPPGPEQLACLPLLDRIVKETARLFPPASIGHCTSAVPFDLGPYHLPGGTVIIYSPYITHRISELYLSPQRFRPERWLFLDPAPHVYLPFGTCGEMGHDPAIAIMETKLVLSMVLQRFSLGLAPSARVDRGSGRPLAPRGALSMIIAPADRPVVQRRAQGNVDEMLVLQ